MSLEQLEEYRIREPRERFNDRLGTEEWVLTYLIPDGKKLVDARPHFRVSLDNTLPAYVLGDQQAAESRGATGAETGMVVQGSFVPTDIYKACVHDALLIPSTVSPGHQEVTVVVRRPNKGMVLQPGRGLMRYGSYSTTVKEEVAVFNKNNPTTTHVNVAADVFAQQRVSLKKEDSLKIEERGLIILEMSDWATNEAVVFKRATAWIGKGDDQQILSMPKAGFTLPPRRDTETELPLPENSIEFFRLKCARVDIQRRPDNVAVLDSVFQFAQKDDKWEESGIVKEQWYAVDPEGKEVEFNPDATPPIKPPTPPGYIALRLRNFDSDVVSGYVDFSVIEDYFTWQIVA